MHPAIFERRAILQGLQARFDLSASEFYAKIGRDEPVRTFRFVVEPCGKNQFHVTDRHTAQVKGIRTGIMDATRFAQQLEDAPVAVQAQIKPLSSVRLFAKQMLFWTVGLTVCMGLFIVMGAYP